MKNKAVNVFHLIPQVKSLRIREGCLKIPGDAAVEMRVDKNMGAGGGDERYSVEITPRDVRLTGASERGLYRAATTFTQLLMNSPRELPCLEIEDAPDFRVRGYYHDVTRGKVPTLDTLKHLADTLAFYKINQLQLYVEHAFAFSKIPELWEGKTPLTSGDIVELDKYCADRFIDLVPSLSTFGHLYEMLRLPRFEHLNELEVRASQTKRCLWDRMAHYTLDVSNPESFELVKGMIEEYLPFFSSPYFNICCDETFDLGKGKNAGRAEREGVGRLYVDFVSKIIGVVVSMGKKPMLWGDIVLKHPELISELPGDVIFLNWDYTPEVSNASVNTFKDAGVTQYVCPGVQGWSRFAADVNRACQNISRMVRYGKDAGAAGVLNTDWGDCGHVNLLANSYHGMAFGADLSWNCGGVVVDGVDSGDGGICFDGVDDNKNISCRGELCSPAFDTRFSFLQWGIDDHRLGKLLRELGGLNWYHFGNLYAWINDKKCLWYKEDDVKAMDSAELTRKITRASEIKKELEDIADNVITPNEFKEYILAADATAWLLSLLLVKKKCEYHQDITDTDFSITPERIIDDGRSILNQFQALWRARNRESELRDVVGTMESVLDAVSGFTPSTSCPTSP